MRTYGRIVPNNLYPYQKQWIEVATDPNGWNDAVYLTTLNQVCKLNLGESPFFSNYGIPAHESVVTQIAPDLYMTIIQQQFAPYFSYLSLTRLPDTQDDRGAPVPTYSYKAQFHTGAFYEGVGFGNPNVVL